MALAESKFPAPAPTGVVSWLYLLGKNPKDCTAVMCAPIHQTSWETANAHYYPPSPFSSCFLLLGNVAVDTV